MQLGLLVCKILRSVRLLAFTVCCFTAGSPISLAQGDGHHPASTLAPQIAPGDLELDSTLANLLHGKSPSGEKLSGEKRPIARSRWVSPHNRHPTPNKNKRANKDKIAKWVARKPQRLLDPRPKPATTPAPTENKELPSDDLQLSPAETNTMSEADEQAVSEAEDSAAKTALGRALSKPRGTSTVKSSVLPSNLPPLTQQQRRLRDKIRRVLTHYYNRPFNTRNRGPWELMHGMLAFEVHSQVLQGGPSGDPITAVGWLCFNQPCKRRTLMHLDKDGEMRVRVGPALQGHQGQLLAMLAQSSVSKKYPIRIDDQEFTVADLIEMEKRTCYPRTELTFKLISMAHYLKTDAQWLNDQGLQWDIPRLIREEIRQPVRGAACGGTHRLAGLTLAYKKRVKRGEPVDGDYLRAKKFVQNYQRYAYRLQNSDGSFSTEWFRGRGNEQDIDRRLKTTGHLLEWLLYASTDQELYDRRTTQAANYLADIMYTNRYRDWEAGPLGHAIHALLVYDRLVYGKHDKWQSTPVASKKTRQRK